MARIKIPIWAIAFALLFANQSPIHGQVRKSQSQPTPDTDVNKAKDFDKKAWITKKPEPTYSKDARKNKIEGTVVLRCVFRASGRITDITVVSGLPDGLTERAIQAAQKIKFKPATKDGHPVSMWMQLEYNFHIY